MTMRTETRVRDVMHRDVATIRPTAPLREAAEMLDALGQEAALLPVVENGRIVGIVARDDLAPRPDRSRRAAEDTEGLSAGPDRRPVERVAQVMHPGLPFCYDDQSLSDARRLMEEEGVHHLAVLGRDRQLVGEVWLSDVMDDQIDRDTVAHLKVSAEGG